MTASQKIIYLHIDMNKTGEFGNQQEENKEATSK